MEVVVLRDVFNMKSLRIGEIHFTGLILCVLLLLGTTGRAVAAEKGERRIEHVKAAFVLNIARFVTWPPEVFEGNGGELNLCLYRRDSLGDGADVVSGKRVGGRLLKIKQVDKLVSDSGCHILLIAEQEYAKYQRTVTSNVLHPLLTIADMTGDGASRGVSRPGVLINLIRNDTRIGIEVDLAQARNAGLKFSSHLLRLARIVGEGAR